MMLLLLASCLIASGCNKATPSKKEEQPAKASEETATAKAEANWWEEEQEEYDHADFLRELTETEQLLVKKPGIFGGDDYDEAAALEKLNELPKGLTAEQYRDAILQLVGEDYYKELKDLMLFDPTIESTAEKPDEEIEGPVVNGVHYAILLDASGSMNAQNAGGTRMEEAKSAIMSFIDVLPQESTVSLRVYGHKGTGRIASSRLE